MEHAEAVSDELTRLNRKRQSCLGKLSRFSTKYFEKSTGNRQFVRPTFMKREMDLQAAIDLGERSDATPEQRRRLEPAKKELAALAKERQQAEMELRELEKQITAELEKVKAADAKLIAS